MHKCGAVYEIKQTIFFSIQDNPLIRPNQPWTLYLRINSNKSDDLESPYKDKEHVFQFVRSFNENKGIYLHIYCGKMLQTFSDLEME